MGGGEWVCKCEKKEREGDGETEKDNESLTNKRENIREEKC